MEDISKTGRIEKGGEENDDRWRCGTDQPRGERPCEWKTSVRKAFQDVYEKHFASVNMF